MTDADDALDLGIGWGACEECGKDKHDVLRVGTLHRQADSLQRMPAREPPTVTT